MDRRTNLTGYDPWLSLGDILRTWVDCGRHASTLCHHGCLGTPSGWASAMSNNSTTLVGVGSGRYLGWGQGINQNPTSLACATTTSKFFRPTIVSIPVAAGFRRSRRTLYSSCETEAGPIRPQNRPQKPSFTWAMDRTVSGRGLEFDYCCVRTRFCAARARLRDDHDQPKPSRPTTTPPTVCTEPLHVRGRAECCSRRTKRTWAAAR